MQAAITCRYNEPEKKPKSSHFELDKVFKNGDRDEFLNEQLRVQDGDVCRSTNQVVRSTRRQRVVDVVSNEVDVRLVNDRLQNVVHHLRVNCSWNTDTEE